MFLKKSVFFPKMFFLLTPFFRIPLGNLVIAHIFSTRLFFPVFVRIFSLHSYVLYMTLLRIICDYFTMFSVFFVFEYFEHIWRFLFVFARYFLWVFRVFLAVFSVMLTVENTLKHTYSCGQRPVE